MLRRVYRQRRRILFGAALLVMTLLISDISRPEGLSIFAGLGPQMRVVLVTLLLGFFSAVSALFIVLLPGLRPMVEVTGLATLMHTTLLMVLPQALGATMWETGFATVALFMLYIVVYMALYGATMDRLPVWFSAGSRHAFRTSASPDAVWRALVPTPGDEAAHWTGTLASAEPLPDEPDSMELRYELGKGLYELQTLTFLERVAPYRCRYYFIAEASATNAQLSEGEYRIEIGPQPGGGSNVETELTHSAMHLRLALMMWFDDVAGDQADSLRARLEGRPDWSVTGAFNAQIARMRASAGTAGSADAKPAGGGVQTA